MEKGREGRLVQTGKPRRPEALEAQAEVVPTPKGGGYLSARELGEATWLPA